jgi:hypothetical protein
MNRGLLLILLLTAMSLPQCKVAREAQRQNAPVLKGVDGLRQQCVSLDSVQTLLIKKAEAILMFDNERYEVTVTLYSKRDSIIYLSAVNSGFEIIRASVNKDSIKVIDRLNHIVYRTALKRKFGYQFPVSFNDLQNLIGRFYLCDDLEFAVDDLIDLVKFEFDENYIKKRIHLDRESLKVSMFEFYHQKTDQYLMGERSGDNLKVYSNFMIGEFEMLAKGGTVLYNQEVAVKMKVNPRKYTFTELR